MVWPEAAIASTYQVWRSCTVTAAVCGATPTAKAVIVAVPLPTAVILPLESTLATPLASVLHTSPRADVGLPAESSTVAAMGAMSPVASVSDPGASASEPAAPPPQRDGVAGPTGKPGVHNPTADDRMMSASRVSASPSASTSALTSVYGASDNPTAAATTR